MTSLGRGVFVPVPTFFKKNEDLDLESFDKHIQYLGKTGLSGIVVLGSMGEAVALSEDERTQVIRQCVESVQKHDPTLKVIAGTSAQSARTTVLYTQQAKQAGAEFVLVLPPSFYRGSIDDESLINFYTEVADKSPLPVVIYNYPGVCQGLDISTAVLVKLSKHENIIGIKGTDGNVGKMADLVQKTDPSEVTLLAGSVDFFVPELLIGAVGLIPGAGNVFPSLCVELQRLYENGQLKEAVELQRQLVEPDDAICRWHGIPGAKSYIQSKLGYGNGVTRNPLHSATDSQKARIVEAVEKAFALESEFQKKK